MQPPVEDFHHRLKRLRDARNLSFSEAARVIGVPISTYREWENGRSILGPKPYALIAAAFKISLHELITGEIPSSTSELLQTLESVETSVQQLKSALLRV